MLTPKVEAKEFENYGFKKYKGTLKESECYYLCVADVFEIIITFVK